jgi:hypothetical protein
MLLKENTVISQARAQGYHTGNSKRPQYWKSPKMGARTTRGGQDPFSSRWKHPAPKTRLDLVPSGGRVYVIGYRESKKEIAIVVDQEYPVFGSKIY